MSAIIFRLSYLFTISKLSTDPWLLLSTDDILQACLPDLLPSCDRFFHATFVQAGNITRFFYQTPISTLLFCTPLTPPILCSRATQIHSVEQSVTGFFSVALPSFYYSISCDKTAKIIRHGCKFLLLNSTSRLITTTLYLSFYRFLVSHLKITVCLSHRQVHQFVHTCIVSRDEFPGYHRLSVHLRTVAEVNQFCITSRPYFFARSAKLAPPFDRAL